MRNAHLTPYIAVNASTTIAQEDFPGLHERA